MIACVCGNISDKAVKQAILNGSDSLESLQGELGVCCACCCCEEFLLELLERHKEKNDETNS